MPPQEGLPGDTVGREDEGLEPTVLAVAAGEAGGTVVGRYRLIDKLGEGGMGEVWLAEQKEPVRRRVAIKLIKAGMNTREVMARFESERQALALMDHPAIAKVLDAGATAQGMPYFVMEHVAGVSITTYCDNHRLSTRERLELFVHVCEGVQHAHQKAIIHRDLKPTNILVTEVDGRPAPKIIDFGVAKALAQKLTDESLYTHIGALIGTPEYMSPEQALSSGEDIDTRSDIYSLGIILYELLAGVPPLELRRAALAEVYAGQGKFPQASALFSQALEIQKRVLGPEHFQTLRSMGNLADTYTAEGKYAQAEPLFAQTLEIQKRVLGPENPDTAQTTYDMGCLEALRGDRDKAFALLNAAVDHGLPPYADTGVEKDPALDSIHNDPRFTVLVAHAKQVAASKSAAAHTSN